jgi:hypothetical protein
MIKSQRRRIVAVERNRRRGGAGKNRCLERRTPPGIQIKMKIGTGRRGNAPQHVDGIIVRRKRRDARSRSPGEARKMNVLRAGILPVVEVFGVNVKKWRLREAPEERSYTEDGARCSHSL